MIIGINVSLPENAPEDDKREKKTEDRNINEYNVAAWKRWVHEYSAIPREIRNLTNKERATKSSKNNIVIVREEEKNRSEN